MATSEAQTFRIPFLLLAVANLAALGTLLWPWQEAINLPPNGTTAVDPAVILLAYLGLIYWVPNGIQEQTRKALSLGATIGILAGLILVARVMVGVRMPVEPIWLQPSLLGVAVILWGVAGLRGSRGAEKANGGGLAGRRQCRRGSARRAVERYGKWPYGLCGNLCGTVFGRANRGLT
jgi:uncharacterized membrane protein HdeD (DUF308 family)